MLTNKIAELARRFLGTSAGSLVDLAKIDRELSPSREPEGAMRVKPEIEAGEKIEILSEYRFVLEAIKIKTPAIFVTGRAGTGKSTLISYLSSEIQHSATVAPTGMAAINVGGSTIHSFFGIPPYVVNPDEAIHPRQQMMPVIETLDVLIIDEVSMVTPNLVDVMDRVLRRTRRNQSPFGGVSVVFVGDLLQLPPVVSSEAASQMFTHRYRTAYFYSADVFSEIEIYPVELRKVFRQEQEDFVDLLSRIRRNSDHRDAVARLNRECFRDQTPYSGQGLFLVPTNAAAKAINTDKLGGIEAPLYVFEATTTGKFDATKGRPPAPDRLELKEGSQVLFLKNNKPYWLNGSVGAVVAIDERIIRVELPGAGNTVSVSRETWDRIEYRYDPHSKRIVRTVVGSFTQFPLALGWAITIHKSQGMTLDRVRIDFGEKGAFCSGQAYVALSRSRTIEGISLDRPLSMTDVKADKTILQFYDRLFPDR